MLLLQAQARQHPSLVYSRWLEEGRRARGSVVVQHMVGGGDAYCMADRVITWVRILVPLYTLCGVSHRAVGLDGE
jgi:hypothetical protein